MNNELMSVFGWDDYFIQQVEKLTIDQEDLIPARIIEVHREQYKIVTGVSEKWARLKGSLFYNEEISTTYPAIGDYVMVKENPLGDDLIYRVLERKSKFSRMDSYYKKEQIVATNFDYIFIMSSLNQDFNVKRIERYLATAWESGAMPIVVLTKLDVCEDLTVYEEALSQIAMGCPVIAVSAHTGEGIEKLNAYIQPAKTIVFLGSSGVGKSSLVNAVAGETVMEVSGIREEDSKGRHTTTHRQLIVLPNGTMVIDTPGMRELEMWNVAEGLSTTFEDVEDLIHNCRFNDCTHKSEPGCAIREALSSGELSSERWHQYTKLKKEVAFAERKEQLSLRQKEKQYQKSRSKFQREIKRKS